MTSRFLIVFLVCLTLTTLLRFWLGRRQIRHVNAHRAAVPEAFAARIPLADHQKAADYTVAKARFAQIDTVLDPLILLILTLGGGLDWLDKQWQVWLPAGEQPLLYGLAMIGSLLLASQLFGLPFAYYRQFVLEARFGFNRMTRQLFFSDLIKQNLIGMVIGTPLILGMLWLMARMGDTWWLYAWLFWCSFNLLMLFIYPTWIAPLFNQFTPLGEGETRQRVEQLLQRCGFHNRGLFVMDGSRRSSHGNAYFTGFGKNKRIVFFDTLLNSLAPAEMEAVLAHELGHFHHRHIVQRIALMFSMALGFLYLLGQLLHAEWFYAALGVCTPNTALGLILFFLTLPVFTAPFGPLMSLLSRRHEFQADAYAARQTNANDLIHALVKLYQDNAATLTPDPLHSAIYDSHPPAALRIAHLTNCQATR